MLVSGGSAANLTALACAREARVGAMDEQRRRLHVRPDALVAGARGAGARLPARPGARDPDRRGRRGSALDALASRGRRRRRRRAHAAGRGRERGHDRDRRRRPVRRARGDLPRARHLAARRRRLRRVRLPHRARARARSRAWSSPTRSRSTRTSGSTSRSSSARCSSATARMLRRGFEISPDFLEDIEAADQEVNFSDLGLQLTRSCRALKLWISLRYFGVGAFRAGDRPLPRPRAPRAAADRGVARARADDAGVARHRHVPPPSRGRRRRGGARADQREPCRADRGRRARSSSRPARVRGRYVLRLCILNHSTSQAEVDRALELAATLPVDASSPAAPARRELSADRAGLAAPAGARRRRPALARRCSRALDDAQADARAARRPRAPRLGWRGDRRAVAGQPRPLRRPRRRGRGHGRRAARWTTSGPGDFFGELAAIDWGAGFARTRTATVTATEPTRLLVLDWVLVNWLMKANARVRRAARGRLARASRAALTPCRTSHTISSASGTVLS